MDAIVVVLIMALIVLGPLALIAWACWRAYRDRNRPMDTSARLPWARQEASARLLAAIAPSMRERGYRVATEGEAGIVFSRRYRPPWLIVPCVVLFPFGLLSLIYVKTVDVSFGVLPASGGTDIAMSGMAPAGLTREIVAALAVLPCSDRES